MKHHIDSEEYRKVCSPLRRRFLEDMDLAGLAGTTKETYVALVARLQRVVGNRPDRLSEADVRSYLVRLRDHEGVAKGTFQTNFYALKFFYYRVLDRDWSLFTKKKWLSPSRSGFRKRFHPRVAHV